jgi:hypothetical protein
LFLVLAAAGTAHLLAMTVPTKADSGNTQARAQGESSFALHEEAGAKVVEINNLTFTTTGQYVPGRPEGERLLLRTTTQSREVIDEKGIEAKVTVEAWPLGGDPAQPPLYAVTREGVGATIEDNALLVFARGTEDVEWWSIFALGTGKPFFDTFVPLLHFPLSREDQLPRYAGFDVPPDDASDAHLRTPEVVGVLTYAAPEHVIRQLLISCSDTNRAAELRSYWDTTRTLSLQEGSPGAEQTRSLHLAWSANDPADAQPVAAAIPLAADDLDPSAAKLPPCMALAPWSP